MEQPESRKPPTEGSVFVRRIRDDRRPFVRILLVAVRLPGDRCRYVGVEVDRFSLERIAAGYGQWAVRALWRHLEGCLRAELAAGVGTEISAFDIIDFWALRHVSSADIEAAIGFAVVSDPAEQSRLASAPFPDGMLILDHQYDDAASNSSAADQQATGSIAPANSETS